jgi:hypothetical protein
MMKSRLYVTGPTPYKFLRCGNDRDCLHSMNAPALALEGLRGGKPLVLSSR